MGVRPTQHEAKAHERVTSMAMAQLSSEHSCAELSQPLTGAGVTYFRGSPKSPDCTQECSIECSPAIWLLVDAQVDNKASPCEGGKGQQACTAIIGQHIGDKRDLKCQPATVAVPAQLDARLHRTENEGGLGHKPLLASCKHEDPLCSIPQEMACAVVNEASSEVSIQAEPPQSYMMCVEALSLIPGLSGQEPQTVQREHTLSSQSIHKEPNKAQDKGT